MYALERKIANSPENGIPALCSVSAELSNQFIALRQNMIYNPDADAKAALQTLQDQMQATMDAKQVTSDFRQDKVLLYPV